MDRLTTGPAPPTKNAGSNPATRANRNAALGHLVPLGRQRAKRALERRREVELRVGQRHRADQVEPRRAVDQHWCVGDRGLDLVRQLQRRRTPRRQQQRRHTAGIERRQPRVVGRLDREQRHAVDRHRPAVAQRVDCLRRGSRGYHANSVMIGT